MKNKTLHEMAEELKAEIYEVKKEYFEGKITLDECHKKTGVEKNTLRQSKYRHKKKEGK